VILHCLGTCEVGVLICATTNLAVGKRPKMDLNWCAARFMELGILISRVLADGFVWFLYNKMYVFLEC
jgi:hypothetical protein